jgi:hypothetical protein
MLPPVPNAQADTGVLRVAVLRLDGEDRVDKGYLDLAGPAIILHLILLSRIVPDRGFDVVEDLLLLGHGHGFTG